MASILPYQFEPESDPQITIIEEDQAENMLYMAVKMFQNGLFLFFCRLAVNCNAAAVYAIFYIQLSLLKL